MRFVSADTSPDHDETKHLTNKRKSTRKIGLASPFWNTFKDRFSGQTLRHHNETRNTRKNSGTLAYPLLLSSSSSSSSVSVISKPLSLSGLSLQVLHFGQVRCCWRSYPRSPHLSYQWIPDCCCYLQRTRRSLIKQAVHLGFANIRRSEGAGISSIVLWRKRIDVSGLRRSPCRLCFLLCLHYYLLQAGHQQLQQY